MTYNFDPDKWQEDQMAMLEARRRKNEITQAQYDAGVLALEAELEAMWARLDGTYALGKTGAK